MTKIQKKLIATVAVLTAVMISICVFLYRAIYVEPNQITITYKMIHDKRIPTDMYSVSIAYFTDLEFGKFETDQRADALFDKIRSLHPDVLLFGGDLFQADYVPSEEEKNRMIDRLSSVDASLGKFAVLGEQDLISEERLALVNDVYARSQIEVIDNSNRLIGNRSKNGIRLIGLRPEANYETSLAGIDSSSYNLLLSHYADPLCSDNVKNSAVSYALIGNSHATQILYPMIGGYRRSDGNTKLGRDKRRHLPFDYLISNGTGCTNINARLNSVPEIVYLLFS